MKKTLSIVVLAVLVLIIGIGIYIYISFGSLVKAGVESYGPQFTGTKVQLGGVRASLLGGEISINDFVVGNPAGFKTSHAFKVGTVKVAVDRDSIMSDTIRIREIVIDTPDIIYELGKGGSNLQTIQRTIQSRAGGGPAKGADKGEGPKVVIDDVYIRNSRVALSAAMLGGKVVPVPIPDIHLKDIGKDKKGGTTMADASKEIMDQLTGSITKAAASINLEDVRKKVEELGKGAKGVVEGVTKELEKGDGGAVEGVTKELKGLFGK